MERLVWSAVLASALMIAGCGDDGGGPGGTVCEPRATQTCTCRPDGQPGVQVCSLDGAGYGACTCEPVTDSGAGFDAGDAGDSASPSDSGSADASSDTGTGGSDASTDAGADASSDTGTGADTGTGTDAGADTGTAADTGTGGTDAGTDAGADTGTGATATDAGPDADGGAMCPSVVVPSPTVSCESATLFCLLGCGTDVACINSCILADANPVACASCMDQSYYSCGTMAGCDREYGCLDACKTAAMCTSGGACPACDAENTAYTACHDAMLTPSDCTGPLLGCYPPL